MTRNISAGKYGILVPYFNGEFSGKTGRFNLYTLDDIQEIDMVQDRTLPGVYKGFRGGFVAPWSGLQVESADI